MNTNIDGFVDQTEDKIEAMTRLTDSLRSRMNSADSLQNGSPVK